MPKYHKGLGEYIYTPKEWKLEKAKRMDRLLKLTGVCLIVGILLYFYFEQNRGVADPGTLSKNATMTK